MMKQAGYFFLAGLLCFATTTGAFAQNSPKEKVQAIRDRITTTHTDIDWNAFDTTSKIPRDSISIEALRGVWKAYNGVFKFNGSVNSMTLTTPLLLEFRDDTYRSDAKSTFKKFALTGNYFSSQDGTWKGYINSVSDKLLEITLNSGDNRMRYYYEK
ncbi:MAG TPA: hypothetical protein VMH27_00130 [Puia sp.]|nr:hypothetical protein [Puia sp.]